jgi:hypothetical protein
MDYREQLIDERTRWPTGITPIWADCALCYQRELPRRTQPAHVQAALALLRPTPALRPQ